MALHLIFSALTYIGIGKINTKSLSFQLLQLFSIITIDAKIVQRVHYSKVS